MSIAKDSQRLQIVMKKDEIKKVEKIANDQGRTMSNWAAQIIRKEIKKYTKKS